MDIDSKRILLVEDEALISMAEADLLKSHGYHVDAVLSGEEAIDKFDHGHAYDLILMDIDLGPGIDGTATAISILEKNDIPVVFLSSHTEAEYLEKTEKITSYGHVVKNSGSTVLLTSIKMAFRLHEAHKNLLTREAMLETSMSALTKSEAFKRKLLESLPVGILVINAQGVIEYENRALKNMMGVPDDMDSLVIGMNIRDIKPITEAGILHFFSDLLEGNIINNIEYRYRSMFGKETDIEISALPIFDSMGGLVSGIIVVTDINERKLAQTESIKYTEQLEFLSRTAMGFINLSPGEDIYVYIGKCLKERLPDYRIIVTEYNEDYGTFTIRAIENYDMIMGKIIDLLGKDPVGLVIEMEPELIPDLFKQKIMSGRMDIGKMTNYSIPASIASKLDNLIDIGTVYAMGFAQHDVLYGHVVMFSPRDKILDNYSLIEAFIKQASVAVQKRRAEENLAANAAENEMLLTELQHRVKNSIAIIAGLIELEKGKYNDEAIHGLLSNLRDRVNSIGALYDILYHRGEVKEIPLHLYLSEMSKKILASYESSKVPVTLETELQEINFDVKRALPVGLIINELITNSLKYAFSHSQYGTIRLTLKKHKKWIKITVSDNGSGISENLLSDKSTGLGLDLIQMLISQLDGEISAKNKNGAFFEFIIPQAE